MLGSTRTWSRRDGNLSPSDEEQGVLGLRLLLGDHGAADGHDEGDDAIDPLGGLVLGGLEIAGGVLGDGVAVVAVAPVRRTSCPPQARVSVRQPGVTGWDRYRKEAVDVGVPAQRAAANIVNQRRMP